MNAVSIGIDEKPVTVYKLSRIISPPVSESTVRNWISYGIKSPVTRRQVCLECRRIGGRLYTSVEAYHRFLAKLNDEFPNEPT